MGRLHKNRDKSENLPDKPIFKAFGKKSSESLTDSFLTLLKTINNGHRIKTRNFDDFDSANDLITYLIEIYPAICPIICFHATRGTAGHY
jgi:hypothetical protein